MNKMALYMEVKDIWARAQDEVLAQYGEFIEENNGEYCFRENTNFVTPQYALIYPTRLLREGDNELLEYQTESGDYEKVLLSDLGLDFLYKLVSEIE